MSQLVTKSEQPAPYSSVSSCYDTSISIYFVQNEFHNLNGEFRVACAKCLDDWHQYLAISALYNFSVEYQGCESKLIISVVGGEEDGNHSFHERVVGMPKPSSCEIAFVSEIVEDRAFDLPFVRRTYFQDIINKDRDHLHVYCKP
jgi:hypothetical protein